VPVSLLLVYQMPQGKQNPPTHPFDFPTVEIWQINCKSLAVNGPDKLRNRAKP
jgi:hypothetical protein